MDYFTLCCLIMKSNDVIKSEIVDIQLRTNTSEILDSGKFVGINISTIFGIKKDSFIITKNLSVKTIEDVLFLIENSLYLDNIFYENKNYFEYEKISSYILFRDKDLKQFELSLYMHTSKKQFKNVIR